MIKKWTWVFLLFLPIVFIIPTFINTDDTLDYLKNVNVSKLWICSEKANWFTMVKASYFLVVICFVFFFVDSDEKGFEN